MSHASRNQQKPTSTRVFGIIAMALFCLPLAILLGLQYLSLKRGYEEQRRATRANLTRYVDIVVKKTSLTYTNWVERVLTVQAETLELEAMQAFLETLEPEELAFARYYFFLVFTQPKYQFYIYDIAEKQWLEAPRSAELRSISLAAGHWHLRNKKGFPAPPGLQINNDLADRPNVMKIIADAEGQPTGVTGVILDPHYFVAQFLQDALPPILGLEEDQDVAAANFFAEVRDSQDLVRLKVGAETASSAALARGFFHQFFAAWQLQIAADDTLELQAKRALQWGLALAVLLSLLPAVGVAFTLRAMLKYRQISAMKAEFVANVSHELRTPMASIQLLGEMMRNGRVTSPAKVREYGGLIELESGRLTRLIENVLDFNKGESGQLPLQKTQMAVAPFLQSTLASFQARPDLGETQFELILGTAAAAYHGDPTALRQALFNLLDNAVKYGPPQQTIVLESVVDEDALRWRVKDQGPGIDEATMPFLFDRFYRGSQGDVHNVRGHGLGLSIAQQIIHGHGGEIRVVNLAEGGCCFEVILPRGDTQA